jgi:hypothetical protein
MTTMTAEPKVNNNKNNNTNFSIKSLSQATRNNRFSKLRRSVVVPQPLFLRQLLFKNKTLSSCSTNTATTQQEQEEHTQLSLLVCAVRISEMNNHVHKVLSRKDYTPEEVQACWYSNEEYQTIERRRSKEIRKLNEGAEPFKDKKYSSRGLECHTAVGAATRRRNKALAYNAVLDQQMVQWEQGIFDEDTIAAIYSRTSSICQLWANTVGQRDHQDIEAYYHQQDTTEAYYQQPHMSAVKQSYSSTRRRNGVFGTRAASRAY